MCRIPPAPCCCYSISECQFQGPYQLICLVTWKNMVTNVCYFMKLTTYPLYACANHIPLLGLVQPISQEPPCKRPRLTPHETATILQARAGVNFPKPKEPPELEDLLIGDFASGKTSATRVSWLYVGPMVQTPLLKCKGYLGPEMFVVCSAWVPV